MRLLIVGSTGGTGRQLIAQALERGHQVTALARRPPQEPPRPGLTWVRGDVLDPASLERAMAGQEAVLSALGHKRWLGPTRILSEGTRNLIAAMERHGVRRLVCETALGISDAWWQMGLYYTLFVRPVILPFYFHDKVRQEAVIRASTLDWTIVRPGALTNGPRRSRHREGAAVGHWLWTVSISRADVAAFMLDQVTDRRYVGATVGLAD
ncbi:MAG: SDR family oxidoreductase [Gemmatimonadota bacterium]|nr:SDR family oxidoreductase [Gemmatimonadota bacterium]